VRARVHVSSRARDVQHTTRIWTTIGLAAAFATLSLASGAVSAGAITVSEGSTAVFTFDFTELRGAQPPYPDMRVNTGIDLASVDPDVDRCRFTFYRDGGGVNADHSVIQCGSGEFEFSNEDSGWLDGVFSMGVTVLSGAITLDPYAMAYTAFSPHGVPMTPRVDPRVRIIPEPAHAALLLVLAGLTVGAPRIRARATGS
jgi:hypothetical protein